MKKTLLITILSFIVFAVYSQPTIQWKKTFGGTGNDFNRCITQTSDGGFITVGGTLSTDGDVTGNHGSFDYWVVKTDAAGTIQWQKALGGTGYDFAHSVKQTFDGGYIIVGWSDSNDGDVTGNHGVNDIWMVKLNVAGNIQWQKSLGGSDSDFAYSVYQNSDSTYVVSGRTFSSNGDVTSNNGGHDYWILKISQTGSIIWQKTYGGSNNDYAYSVTQTLYDGGYVVVGHTTSSNGDVVGSHGGDDVWVLKLDGAGNIQWKKALGGTGNDYAKQIYQTGDLGFIIIGDTESNDGDVSGNHGLTDCWIIKLDASGTIQWQKVLGSPRNDIGLSIQQAPDNGYIVAAWSDSIVGYHGGADYWLMKLDPSGNTTWEAPFGGSVSDYAYSIDITADGGFVVSGNSNSNNGDVSGNHGLHDFWIIKFNGLPLSITNSQTQLLTVYPNPGNGLYNIINAEADSKIEIYDITGRIVLRTTIKEKIFSFDLTASSNGIYFYKIIGANTFTGKLIKVVSKN